MNEIIKKVNFQGQQILSVLEDDKIYISVKSICDNLGMTVGQIKNQRNKVQNDELLKGGFKTRRDAKKYEADFLMISCKI